MNISQIRLGLGRVKSSCARRDLERALDLAIAALDALGGQTPPTDLRGDIRNAVAEFEQLEYPTTSRIKYDNMEHQKGKVFTH